MHFNPGQQQNTTLDKMSQMNLTISKKATQGSSRYSWDGNEGEKKNQHSCNTTEVSCCLNEDINTTTRF